MDEVIRSRMHEALEIELPDIGLRARIMSSLPADTRLGRARRRWVIPTGVSRELAAGIAALLLAAIVIGTFAYIRAATRPHVVTPPITSPSPNLPRPSPKPLTQSLIVDPATPVILFNDAGNFNQIDGMTWNGQEPGKVTTIPTPAQPVCTTTGTTETCSPPPVGGGAPPLTGAQWANPAGTLFVAFPYFYDRSGKVVATLKGGPYDDPGVGLYFVGTWADDELHYCQLVPIFGGTAAVTGTLQVTTPGGAPRDVAQVGTQAAGENTLTVKACSVLADRAVVVQVYPSPGPNGNQVNQYWAVQLSTGQVLWTHNLAGSGITNVVPSRDGRYVAEVQQAGTTTIYGTSGSAAGHVNGVVEAFSWDGSLALVFANGGQASVVRWSDGTAVWTVPAGEGVSGFEVEPGGSHLAILTLNSDLYLVSSDGHVIAQRQLPGYLLGGAIIRASGADVAQMLPEVMAGNVGWADGPQRTTDGGLHWQDASPPQPPNRTKGGNSNFFLDVDRAWVTVATGAAGQPSATQVVIFATTDGGQTWRQASVPISGAATEAARVDFIDAQHGWLITDSGRIAFDKTNTSMVDQPVTRAVYATTDGGHSWNQVTSGHEGDGSTLGSLALGCHMNALSFTNLNDGWITWDSGCSSGPSSKAGPPIQQPAGVQVAVTHNGGRSWQPVNPPSFPSTGSYCIAHPPVFTSNQGVLPVDCGGNGQPGVSAVYVTNDGGRTWTVRKLPFSSQQLDFVDAFTGWTFGPGVDLYRTTDGGRTWVVAKRFAPEQNANGLKFVDSKVGFALTSRYAADGNSGYSTMWKTTDGGQTWAVMSSKATGPRCC